VTIEGVNDESAGFSEKDLPQLQDHPQKTRGARDLQGPAA
jgi:hypothetical protein